MIPLKMIACKNFVKFPVDFHFLRNFLKCNVIPRIQLKSEHLNVVHFSSYTMDGNNNQTKIHDLYPYDSNRLTVIFMLCTKKMFVECQGLAFPFDFYNLAFLFELITKAFN